MAAAPLEPDRLVRDIARARCRGAAAEQLQSRIAVEPALTRQAERAEREILGVEPRKPPRQLGGGKKCDVSVATALERMLAGERLTTGSVGEIQVAGLNQTDLARDGAQEGDAHLRDRDVYRSGKLLSDRAGRQRRGSAAVARVALDDGDALAEK